MTNRGDMPAIPLNAGWQNNDPQAQGLTVKECFVLAALQGLCANPDVDQLRLTDEAVQIADNQLRALAGIKPPSMFD